MAPWPNQVMIGTDLSTDFKTLDTIFSTDEALEPDMTFRLYSAFDDNTDGSRTGKGFPEGSLTWAGLDKSMAETLYGYWDGALSVPLYVRLCISRVSSGENVYRTFLTQALWMQEEDLQADYKLNVSIDLRHMLIQAEAT